MVVKPVAAWIERERLNSDIVKCLTVILRTKGCYWAKKSGCLMCGFIRESRENIGFEELKEQFEEAIKSRDFDMVKIFTSGSFLDPNEVPSEFRWYLYEKLDELGVKKLIIESRPEFINENIVNELKEQKIILEVAIGLETADDFIREYCINKGFKFDDFRKVATMLRDNGIRVKAYLLLKPPFLSESEAIEDVCSSALKIKDLVDIISVNLTNVQAGTYVERLWKRKLYRPPWLWSAVEVLKRIKNEGMDVICDPVAAGKPRGPHNCGKCDKTVERAIREFSLSQDLYDLQDLSCNCLHLWKKVLELENYSRVPLVF